MLELTILGDSFMRQPDDVSNLEADSARAIIDDSPESTNSSSPSPEPFTPPPSKKPSRQRLIMSIIGVILIAGLSVLLFWLLQPKSATPTNTQTTDTATPGQVSLETLGSKVDAIFDTTKSAIVTDTGAPTYNVNHNNYFTPIDKGSPVLTVTHSEAADSDGSSLAEKRSQLLGVLKDAGLTLAQSNSDLRSPFSMEDFVSKDIVCLVQVLANKVSKQNELSLHCALTKDYTKTAAALKPYMDAFAKSDEAHLGHLTDFSFSNTSTVDSDTTKANQKISLTMSGHLASASAYTGLYYTTPDGTLRYFTGTQGDMECSKFNTDELRQAYLGTECYNPGDTETSPKRYVTL